MQLDHKHFTTRPGVPRVRANVPIASLESESRTVKVIVFADTEPAYEAEWESGVSSTRIGPPCSRTKVPTAVN